MERNLTDDFGHYYKPAPDDERRAFDDGLIVLDANVLLHVLRYSSHARDELLRVIESIGTRCFVPHQVAAEYNLNRVSVVAARHKELAEAEGGVDEIRVKFRALIGRIRDRRIVSGEIAQKLDGTASSVIAEFNSAVADAMTNYDLSAPSMVGQVDQWTERLATALRGRVAAAPTEELRQADLKEAKRRREEKLAPGFKDEEGGDYLWWAEVLRHPGLRDRPLLVVSDDVAKGDWVFEQHGVSIGPHEILISDVIKAGGRGVWLATTHKLLRLAEDSGLTDVSASTLAESERLLDVSTPAWTLEGYTALLSALENESYLGRARVIRAAAARNGYLDREAVYEIAQLDVADRSLRQFATPVQRLTRRLTGAGVAVAGVKEALEAQYDGPGKAIGYSVPAEFVEFEATLRRADEYIENDATLDWHIREQGRAHLRSGLKRMLLSLGADESAERIADLLLDRAEASLDATKH